MKTLELYQIPIFIMAVIIFCWLAVISIKYEPSYTRSDIQSMNALIARITAPPSTFAVRQASALSELYGITVEEAAKPVRLFQ